MATAGLTALTGSLLHWFGDLVVDTKQIEHASALRMTISHSDRFKQEVKAYVEHYNKTHGTHVSVAFPKPFVLRLRVPRRSARAKR